jgi:hypothetical protein
LLQYKTICKKKTGSGEADMKKKKIMISMLVLLMICTLGYFAYQANYLPHPKYENEDFGIETYMSSVDRDGDGIDDQSDILQNVRTYIATRPQYKSKYYATGYPDDHYGVCTDVVAFGLLGAGYNLMSLVNEDILLSPQSYAVERPDINIDFRRVRNLKVYLERHAISLGTDFSDIASWQGGDIVVFPDHIGIVSDKRNKDGIPFVVHHSRPWQLFYEEDILGDRNDITGHYRIS